MKLRENKQYEEVLIERAVKTFKGIIYDNGFYDNFDKRDDLLKE